MIALDEIQSPKLVSEILSQLYLDGYHTNLVISLYGKSSDFTEP